MKQAVKLALAGVMFGIMAFTFVGCGKGDKGDSRSGLGYGGFPGNGYPGYGNGAVVAAALGNNSSGTLQLALEFQSANSVPQYGGGNMYGGSVAAYGMLFVSQNISCGMGYIPAGQYQVQATSPGSISNGLISNMQLAAVGGYGQMAIVIQTATILQSFPKNYACSGGQSFDELSGIININGCSVYIQTLNYPSVCQ